MGGVLGMTAALVTVFFAADQSARQWSRRQRLRVMASRERLDGGALYRSFCPNGELEPRHVIRALVLAADCLGVPVGALRPLDRLQDLACPAPGWRGALQVWNEIDDLADEFSSKGPALVDRDFITIGQLIREAAKAWQTRES